ncbi:hypothetical protein BH20CHL1_BH20CHL1_06800 [soil metagenome]|jgi:hypothetical protein|nr:hypothetical protein [Chloroflexia bacterium]
MSKTLKDKISRALDEAGAKARDIAKSIGLLPNPPRLAPIPIPVQPVRPRR